MAIRIGSKTKEQANEDRRSDVPVTECKTESHTVLTDTPHGKVKTVKTTKR